MKKIAVLLLVASLVSVFTGCALLEKVGIGGDKKKIAKICEIANQSAPTKVITDVSFVTNKNDSLKGYYSTVTDGKNMVFDFSYQRFATPEESLASGSSDRIITVEGVINYRDGVFFGADGGEWRPGSGTALELKLNFDPSYLNEVTVEAEGNALKCKISKENLAAVIGTDLNAIGDADVTLTTNGINLTMVEISCITANGKFTIRTSNTYNKQDLFPETEEPEAN